MKNNKFYFRDTDSIDCYSLQYHLEQAKEDELSEVTLVEAVPDNDNADYIYCKVACEVCERNECKKALCADYESKSGRGVCKHRGKLYEYGKEVIFQVPQ